jgi:type I restriction enzyme S subunit
MLKGYSEYKKTILPWLKSIPSHWDIKRAKGIFFPVNERSQKGKEELLSVSSKYGVIKRKNANVTMFMADSYENYKLCWENDLVINSLWAWQTGLGFSSYHGIISTAYSVFRLKNLNNNCRFLHYLLRGTDYQWELQVRSKGIWRSRYQLSDNSFLDSPIILPPRFEQDQIVRYLDWKISMINKYINAKKKQIELLKEQKQAIINQAVTKGLDLKVPMKNSGIEWLGKMPAHWELRRLKTLGIARNGIMFEPKDLNDYGTLVLRSSNIKNNQLVFDDNIYVKMPIKDNFILKENDLLICSRNGSRELIGKCALIDKQTAGQTYGAFMCIFRGIDNEYVYYVFQSNILNYYLGTFTTSTINQLTNSNLYSIKIPFPNEEERKAIIIFLRKQCSTFDDLINKFDSEIKIMQEYRTRLISDVVTGKVNVQGEKVPEFKTNIENTSIPDIDEEAE